MIGATRKRFTNLSGPAAREALAIIGLAAAIGGFRALGSLPPDLTSPMPPWFLEAAATAVTGLGR